MSTPTKEDIINEQILLAAKRLFQTHGLQKVTMDDVAKAIGKGRSSLYYYYKSKDEIFDAVMNIEIKEMLNQLTREVERASSIEEKISAFFLAKLKFHQEKKSFYQMLDLGMDADALSNFNKTKLVHHELIMKLEAELLRRVLAHAQKSGEVRRMYEEELDRLIFILLSTVRGVKRELFMANTYENIEPVIKSLTNIIMNGISA